MAWEEVQACGQFRIKELGGSTGEPAAPRALPRAGGSPLWLWAASIHSLYCEQALVLEVEVRSPHHVSCPIGKRPR